jgi:acyl-CoA dehydrogenase
MADKRRRITLPPVPSQGGHVAESSQHDQRQADERRPLLGRLYSEAGEDGDPVYSCRTDPHSHLPVYTNIHRIRRDIVSVVEDYLSLEQLRDVRINLTVVRPLVDKFYGLDDISISMLFRLVALIESFALCCRAGN